MKLLIEKNKENTLLPRILREAVNLFVEKGIDGTTIKDIARKSEVSEGALYRHFKSKEELAYSLFSTHVNAFSLELMEKMGGEKTAHGKLKSFVYMCFESFEEDRNLFQYLIVSEHRELRNFPANYVHPGHVAMKLVEEGRESGEFRKTDVVVAASMILGTVLRMCLSRTYGAIPQRLNHYQEEVADSLWRALKK